MVFGCLGKVLSIEYCYQCTHGPDGCMMQSNHGEGTDIRACNEEIEAKLRPLARKQHTEIEAEIALEKKTFGANLKILLLGGPSSGKSTIFKQMQIIHCDGFKSQHELLQYRTLIDSNIRDIYNQLVTGSRVLGVSLEPIQHILYDVDDLYKPMSNEFAVRTTPELCEALTAFWNSETVQELYKRRVEFELMDSSKYYFENLSRISQPDYMPNNSDIVHSRKATVSINSIVFLYTQVSLHMIDVGGQQSERRKWLHLFDDIKTVMFVIDLTGYAKKSEESKNEILRFPKMFEGVFNHHDAYDMKVALKIFLDVVNATPLAQAVFLVFFNKVDLFKELVPHVKLSSCFTKYDGENTYDEMTKFIVDKFVKAAKPKKSIFPHFTTATNTENVNLVFRACMESVFKANSKATGLS